MTDTITEQEINAAAFRAMTVYEGLVKDETHAVLLWLASYLRRTGIADDAYTTADAFAAGLRAGIEAAARVVEESSLPDVYSEPALVGIAAAIRELQPKETTP